MKILILANNSLVIYKFKKELLKELIAQGHNISISLPDQEFAPQLTELGCELIKTEIDRRGINIFKDMRLYRAYKKMIKRLKPDMILTYTIKPNIYASMIAKKFNIPYFVNITGLGTAFQKNNLLKKLVSYLYKKALKRVRTVFFENEENRSIFVKEKIVKKDKTLLLNGAGVNLREYTFEPLRDNSVTEFLFVGRIMREKGVEELFTVAKRIKEKYPNVQFSFLGKYEEDYHSKIEVLEKDSIIQYYGFHDDIRPYLSHAQCLVLPSYHEGMGNVLLEAAAMGRPLITSNISGCREAVIQNENGYLVQSKDIESLYCAVERFILLDAEQRQQMGKRSRALVEEKFDRDIVTRDIVNNIMGELSSDK